MRAINVFTATLRELHDIEYEIPKEPFNGIVIVSTGKVHESGYLCMKLVFVSGCRVVGCAGGCCDVLHLNGIGGYGLNYKETIVTQKVDHINWQVDLLPNGCVRIYTSKKLQIGSCNISDFEVFDAEVKHDDI